MFLNKWCRSLRHHLKYELNNYWIKLSPSPDIRQNYVALVSDNNDNMCMSRMYTLTAFGSKALINWRVKLWFVNLWWAAWKVTGSHPHSRRLSFYVQTVRSVIAVCSKSVLCLFADKSDEYRLLISTYCLVTQTIALCAHTRTVYSWVLQFHYIGVGSSWSRDNCTS